MMPLLAVLLAATDAGVDPATSLAIRGSPSLWVGQSVQLRAEVTRLTKGDEPLGTACTWRSSDSGLVTVDKTGLIIGVRAGTASVRALCGALEAQVSVEVWDPAVVGSFSGVSRVHVSNLHRAELCELELALTTAGARVTLTTRTAELLSVLTLAADAGAPRTTASDAVAEALGLRWTKPAVTTWTGSSAAKLTSGSGASASLLCRSTKRPLFKRPARWERDRSTGMDCEPGWLGPAGPSRSVDLLECVLDTPLELSCARRWLLRPDGGGSLINPAPGLINLQEHSDCRSRAGLWELSEHDLAATLN